MTKRRFEFSEGGSNKFWEVSIDGNGVVTTYGRIGASGQTTIKTEANAEKAKATCEKLVREKTKKGYVEVGGSAAPSPSRGAPPKRSAAGKPISVKAGGQVKYVVPLKGGRCVVLDNQETLTWYDAKGKSLGTRKVGDSGAPRALPDGKVVIVSGKTVLVLDDGKLVRDLKTDVARVVSLGDGQLVTLSREGDQLSSLDPNDGKLKPLAKPKGKVSFLVAGHMHFMTAQRHEGSDKSFTVYDAGGKELSTLEFSGKRHSAPLALRDGRFAVASDERVLFDSKKATKLPGIIAAPIVESGDVLAVPIVGGQVSLLDQKGKVVATVRRDPRGAGENEVRITNGPDGSFVLPGLDGTVHHVSATGEMLGSLKLGNALSQKSEAATLDDGTFVVADSKEKLHFFGVEHFGASSAPVVTDLSKERAELTKHFEPWLATPQCRETLEALLSRLTEVRKPGKALELCFETDASEIFEVTFGAPGKKERAMPASYNTVVALHGSVVLGDGVPDELQFGDCNMEHDGGDRWIGLCDAGQNWLAFDTKTKNKLGEPSIVLVDHGAGIEDASAYPTQKKQAFGVPGHLLRSIAFRVLEKDDRFEEFSWG